MLKRLWKEEEGQGMVEYGLIVGLIAVAAIAILIAMGPKIKDIFGKANDALGSATTN